jgi:hypothetical protein
MTMGLSSYSCSRRNFLKLASSSILLTTFSIQLAGCGESGKVTELIATQLMGLLNYPQEATKIGRLYINQTAELENKNYLQLTEGLLASLNIDESTDWVGNPESLNTLIREKVKQDFIDENVVILKGWMLSETEVLLCAITSSYSHNLFVLAV